MRGPASAMSFDAESIAATQPPLHIRPDEFLHQLGPMGVDVTPESLQDQLVEIPEPARVHQRAQLREHADRNLRSYGGSWRFGAHGRSLARIDAEPPPRSRLTR